VHGVKKIISLFGVLEKMNLLALPKGTSIQHA
jgi:hypothetical protein